MNQIEKLRKSIEDYEKATGSFVVEIEVKRTDLGLPRIRVVCQEFEVE